MKKLSVHLILVIFLLGFVVAFGGKNTPLTPIEQLGKELFFDKLSDPDWMSCATCHAPDVGFTGPIAGINAHGAVYRGAVPQRFGNRKPPSAAYATLSPVFYYDATEGLFIGGNFWDGRATGEELGNPAADQALGPFLNPVEQNNASKEAVLRQIEESNYFELWQEVWGPYDPSDIEGNYDRIGLSIAAYEGSAEVNQFSSKYDYYLQGLVDLTPEEAWGLQLFDDPLKGNCAACHPSTNDPGEPILFTDFSYDNLGTPKNPENPFYDMDEVFLDDGTPINPLGDAWIDHGLGGFLATHPDPVWQTMAGDNMGKHKVPTLRNVAKSPGNNFPKAFMHNGVFKSLKEVVHFYNTRDVASWPPPEVAFNVNSDELGDLGLSDAEEDAIVAFMETLSDGYKLKTKEATTNIIETLKIAGPNPFNPTTKLAYTLAEDSDIKIDVYNITGQYIETLEKSYKASGNYEISWNAQHLSSGVYIVILKTDNHSIMQRVVLLK